MKRSVTFTFAAAAAFALITGIPSTGVQAQNPPSDRDIQIYAGLHAAAQLLGRAGEGSAHAEEDLGVADAVDGHLGRRRRRDHRGHLGGSGRPIG